MNPQVQTTKLDNGLTLVTVPQRGSGLIAYYSLVRVGSRDETEKGVTGFAHFFEHMMFRGTKDYPPERVSAFLKKTGADQNGFTTDDYTCYTFFGLSNDLAGLVAMESDRFQNLEYSVDVFKTESKAVLGEYNKSASSPSLPLRERLREKVFTKHTYGHTTLGYLRDIEDMPNQYEYSRKFFERFYTPDNTTVIAVGDFDPMELRQLVRQHYGAWTGKRAKSGISSEPRQGKEVREHVEWASPTLPLLSMSWRTPKTNFASKDTAVYGLMFEILFGKASKLYRELVLDKKVVRSFSEWSWNHRDPYLVHVVATLNDRASLTMVESAVDSEIERLAKGEITDADVDAPRSHVRYSALLHMSTPANIASTLAYQMGAGGEANSLETYLEVMAEVTVDDVERFARLYLANKNRSVITLATTEAK